MDKTSFALVAALTLVPGLGFMWINDLVGQPLAWLALVGLGGGIIVVWASGQSADAGTRSVLGWIGGALMLAGFAASLAMGLR